MDHIMNYTYTTKVHDLEVGDYMTISHTFPQRINYAKFTKASFILDDSNLFPEIRYNEIIVR